MGNYCKNWAPFSSSNIWSHCNHNLFSGLLSNSCLHRRQCSSVSRRHRNGSRPSHKDDSDCQQSSCKSLLSTHFVVFNSMVIVNEIAYVWIRTADLWWQKRPLYQLHHKHISLLIRKCISILTWPKIIMELLYSFIMGTTFN